MYNSTILPKANFKYQIFKLAYDYSIYNHEFSFRLLKATIEKARVPIKRA